MMYINILVKDAVPVETSPQYLLGFYVFLMTKCPK